MEKDLNNVSSETDSAPVDDQKATLLLKKYHSLIYQLFHSDHQQNISLVQEHCSIPHHYQQCIMTAATARDSNERILTFLEDTFLQSGKSDEFFMIVHKLIEMPSALPIIKKMQEELNSSINKKTLMKLSMCIAKEPNGNGTKSRSAKSIMTNVMTKTLCSIPGYNILEDYKDRICTSLPDDYNNTAVRLQTLIGASDHMIQWILTGDMSQVNHRIYQVVLVYVCFQPHFIKFCDIMEVLAADSITIGYIQELRKTLIKQLYSDGHITAEEASELTSKKLFKIPDVAVAAAPAISPLPPINATHTTITTAMTSTNFSTELCTRTVECITNTTNVQSADSVSVPSTATLDECNSNHQNGMTSLSLYTVVTSDNVTVTSNNVLQLQQHGNDTITISGLKTISATNGMTVPHQIPIAPSKVMPLASLNGSSESPVQEVQESSDTEANPLTTKDSVTTLESVAFHALTYKDDKQSLSLPPCTQPSKAIDSQSIKLPTDSINGNNLDTSTANAAVSASSCGQSVDETSKCGSSTTTYTSSLDEKNKSLTTVTATDMVFHSTDAVPDASALEFGSDAVCDILKAKDFAIVKVKYADILSCFPVNYEGTISCLQNYLSDTDICELLSLTSGHNQRLLNLLILRLKNKEDLLDFCDGLEKINGASSLLKTIAEQLRKEAIEMISKCDQHLPPTSKSSQTVAALPKKPPRKIIPFHQKLLEIPEVTKPFDACLLADDSEGLAALKQCYPNLIDNLPSNHLTSLVRLQNVAIIPEAIVDIIVPSSSAEIGNKMIINYLVGLIHTEEHIITFCYFAERMIGEFDKCICVLNLKNTMLMSQKCEVISIDHLIAPTVDKDKSFNTSVDISCDWLKTQYADQPDIRALIKARKHSGFYKPFMHECGALIGYSKCIMISSHGHSHDDVQTDSDVNATTDEDPSSNDMEVVKDYVKRDYLKEYAFSMCGEQGSQLSKKQAFESIEIFFKESTRGGAMIYYTGCGEEGTGNWCFKDGVISLNDILSLYDKYLKKRLLMIYADCSYSGQWVLDYANCLDEMGIGACGHQITKHKKFLKILTSCQPSQKVTAKSYTTKAMSFSDEDDSLWVYTNLKLSDNQTTYGCNFSKIQCFNLGGPTTPCQLSKIPSRCSWKWKDVVDIEYDNRPGSRLFTVRGKDKGREAWHIVLVEKDLLESFKEKVSSGTVDVAKFGYVIKSGWGKDPPDDVVNKLKRNG